MLINRLPRTMQNYSLPSPINTLNGTHKVNMLGVATKNAPAPPKEGTLSTNRVKFQVAPELHCRTM